MSFHPNAHLGHHSEGTPYENRIWPIGVFIKDNRVVQLIISVMFDLFAGLVMYSMRKQGRLLARF